MQNVSFSFVSSTNYLGWGSTTKLPLNAIFTSSMHTPVIFMSLLITIRPFLFRSHPLSRTHSTCSIALLRLLSPIQLSSQRVQTTSVDSFSSYPLFKSRLSYALHTDVPYFTLSKYSSTQLQSVQHRKHKFR